MVDDTRKLEIGRVFRDTFSVIRREVRLLTVVTLLLSTLPGFALSYIQLSQLGGAAYDPMLLIRSPLYAPMALVGGVLGLLVMACLFHITIAALDGRRTEPRELLQAASSKLLPLIGVAILSFLGIGLGMFLLVVPGVILAIMWIVATPVVVGETSNVFQAFGRSRALTKGNRWRIFGLVLLVWIVLGVIGGLFLGVTGGVLALAGPGGPKLPALIVSALSNFLTTLVVSVGTAALYVQLRDLKGGGASVAQVFA